MYVHAHLHRDICMLTIQRMTYVCACMHTQRHVCGHTQRHMYAHACTHRHMYVDEHLHRDMCMWTHTEAHMHHNLSNTKLENVTYKQKTSKIKKKKRQVEDITSVKSSGSDFVFYLMGMPPALTCGIYPEYGQWRKLMVVVINWR